MSDLRDSGAIEQHFQGEYARFCDLNPAQNSQTTTPAPAHQTIAKPKTAQSAHRSLRHKEAF